MSSGLSFRAISFFVCFPDHENLQREDIFWTDMFCLKKPLPFSILKYCLGHNKGRKFLEILAYEACGYQINIRIDDGDFPQMEVTSKKHVLEVWMHSDQTFWHRIEWQATWKNIHLLVSYLESARRTWSVHLSLHKFVCGEIKCLGNKRNTSVNIVVLWASPTQSSPIVMASQPTTPLTY